MVSLPRYENYKDSGVEWLGEIPKSWKIEKAKWIFQQVKRPTRKTDEVVTCFRDGQVTLRSNRRIDGFTNAIQEHGYQGIRKGDLIIHAMDAFAGAIGVSDSDGKSTPVYSVCLPRSEYEINSYFYAYLLRYIALSGFILSLAKGIRERSTDFRYKDFAELLLPIPTIAEQKRIAEFLDRKCGEIDEAIAKKQRLIELLEEQKTILINQAVTKGLNPDAPMKDSGIDWLGEIPAHWDIQKIKYIFNFFGGATPNKETKNFWDGDVLWFAPKDMKKRYLSKSLNTITDIALTTTKISLLPKNTILIVVRGMILARKIPVALTQVKATINQDMKGLITKRKDDYSEFFICLLEGINQSMFMLLEEAGHGTKTLPTENLSNFLIPLPPKNEQIQIVDCIKMSESKINQTSQNIQSQIIKLTELKQILIAEAVTGKIKV